MKGGLGKQMSSAIDRARRDLSGTIIGFVGTGIEANRFQKYSNPDLRYLTCCYRFLFLLKIILFYQMFIGRKKTRIL